MNSSCPSDTEKRVIPSGLSSNPGEPNRPEGSPEDASPLEIRPVEDAPPRPRIGYHGWVIFGVVTMIYLATALSSLQKTSVTVDEYGNLPVGVNILQTGDFRYCEFHPPLANLLWGAPLVLLENLNQTSIDPKNLPDPGLNVWFNGYVFMKKYYSRYTHLMNTARLMTVGLGVLLGLLVFVWAADLSPQRPLAAGLLSVILVWFSPNFLSHVRLVSNDPPLVFFMVLSIWSLHRWLLRPTLGRWMMCGASLGLAFLSKGTSIFLIPLYAILTAAWTLWREPNRRLRRWIFLAGAFVVSLGVLNLGFLFQGSGKSIGEYEFHSRTFLRLQSLAPSGLPMFLPQPFVATLDRQFSEAGARHYSYLHGESYRGGRWYYYLVLLALKTPIAMLVLAVLAAVLAIRRRVLDRFEAILLLLPPLVILLAFSLFSDKQLGLRMVLPMEPFMWICVGVIMSRVSWGRGLRSTLVLSLGCLAMEIAWVYPDFLAFFNGFVGGPRNGYRWALDSNYDWGQGLIELRKYMKKHRMDTVQLFYFGRVDPAIYGIRYEVPSSLKPRPGLLVVSATLQGCPYYIFDHGEPISTTPQWVDASDFGLPIDRIGYSLFLYRIEPKSSAP